MPKPQAGIVGRIGRTCIMGRIDAGAIEQAALILTDQMFVQKHLHIGRIFKKHRFCLFQRGK